MKTTVTVRLQLTNANGFTSEESMLAWIRSCLNCNPYHVVAEVSIAPPDVPAAVVLQGQ